MRNFVMFFDVFLVLFILFAPLTAVQFILWPLYAFSAAGFLVYIIKNKPIKEIFVRPPWWIYYDILTDLVFLALIYYAGLTTLFWLAFFMSGAKHFIKRTPYETNSN